MFEDRRVNLVLEFAKENRINCIFGLLVIMIVRFWLPDFICTILVSQVLWLCDFGHLDSNCVIFVPRFHDYVILVSNIPNIVTIGVIFNTKNLCDSQVAQLSVKLITYGSHRFLVLKSTKWEKNLIVTNEIPGYQNCTIVVFEEPKSFNWNLGTKIAQLQYVEIKIM